MTIQIDFASGYSEEFSDCSGYSNDGKVVRFKGRKDGDDAVKEWEINFDAVISIARF